MTQPAVPTLQQLLAAARTFHPSVYFSKSERYFPCSIEWLLQNSTLASTQDKSFSISSPTPADLAQYNNAGYFLNVRNQNGMPLQNGAAVAPMYVSVQFYDNLFVDINYLFLSAYNGPQAFLCTPLDVNVSSFYCIISSYAEHQGDLERVFVRLLPDLQTLVAVGFDAHGHTTISPKQWVLFDAPGQFNPIVYAGLNSHASYGPSSLGSTTWTYQEKQLVVEVGDWVDHQGPRWAPGDYVLVGLNGSGQPINDQTWVLFGGTFGALQSNSFQKATAIDYSSLALQQTQWVSTYALLAQLSARARQKMQTGDPPKGLATRHYIQQQPIVAYAQIVSNQNPDYALSANPDSPNSGLVVMQSNPNDPKQLWYLDRWDTDQFVLWNKAMGSVAVCPAASDAQVTLGRLEDSDPRAVQWQLGNVWGKPGYYMMKGYHDDQVLDVWGGTASDRCEVHIYDTKAQSNQLWAFTVANHDVLFYHQIVSTVDHASTIAADKNNATGTPVLASSNAADDLQLWALVPDPVNDGNFTLRNKAYGTYLTFTANNQSVGQAQSIDPARSYWNLGGEESTDPIYSAHAIRLAASKSMNLTTTGDLGDPITTQGWGDNPKQIWWLSPVKIAPSTA